MKNKTQKGITLVALVITIIVLLILAGVAINMAIDSDGLFGKANEAATKWNIATQEEQNAIENVLLQANEISGTATKQGSIELNKTSLTLEIVDGVNVEETLVATLKNIVGEVNWTSSDLAVATVDSNGKITTVGAGETTITASYSRYAACCKVTVVAKTTPKVTLSASTGEVEVESTLVLTASLNVIAEENIVWTSSDTSIATVAGSGTNNITGTITGIKAGTVTITAKYGGKEAKCNLTVNPKTKFTVTFYNEDKTTVLATVQVEKGNTATYTGAKPTKAASGSDSYVFSYWVKEDGSKANLENITDDLNVYAYFTVSTCFVAGTKVLTETGLMNIEDIQVGMKVYSMNEETGETELKTVINTFKNIVDKDMCKVYTNGEVIESTSGHKYYEVNKGWIEASELQVGDLLLKANGTQKIVEKLEIIEFNGNLNTVYNLEVEDNHNYFVGKYSVLVHNPTQC